MISLRRAAELTGKSKSTLTRAIKTGRLSAARDAQGVYAIDPAELAREFEPSAQAICNWVVEADRREGRAEPKTVPVDAGLGANEREELLRLRRENKQLKLERDILSRAAAWFARETGAVPSGSSNS